MRPAPSPVPPAFRRRPRPLTGVLLLGAWLAAMAGTATAQYKVVAPDGSVTYTDRPVSTPGAKVQSIGRSGVVLVSPNQPLPNELRPVVARFPVTLYTGSDCGPCDSARALLRQRGVPFTERSIGSEDDAAALQRLSNGRTLPTLAVGQQVLRGWLESDWTQTLDLAGYPKESRLPRDWVQPAATPLVARAAEADNPPPVQARPAPRPAVPEVRPEPPASGPNIRF